MNDATGETASSLAIIEKRPHRPGGCVGIFFQLFDWNRRFAKKKLFSKKFLPPARAKQASKKFGGDEKLPKLRLIADENSGGFPNLKKNGSCNFDSEQKHEMRAPGLVARLMGLESMPAVQRDKPKKGSLSGVGNGKAEKFVSNHSAFDRDDFNLEKGVAKHELRPQKLQKTGSFERLPVTKFGAEALQFKSILSRARKHHPKLASPVKSPRIRSARNASRWIDAATKILEPGLQSKSRAKCALTYSNKMHRPSNDEVMLEGTTAVSPDLLKDSNYYASAAKLVKGQSSCRNCGNFLEVVNSRPNVEEQPSVGASVLNYVYPSSQVLERINPRPPISFTEQERERVFEKNLEHSTSPGAQATDNIRHRAEPIPNRKPLDQEGQSQWHLTGQQCKPQKVVPSSLGFKQKTQRQNQASPGRDRVLPRSKSSNLKNNRVSSAANAINETKDFVALNRSLSGRTRSRMPAKVDNCKFDMERKFGNRRDDSLSPVRKRRSMNVSKQGENSGFVSSTFSKRNISCNAMTGKETGHNAHFMNPTCMESRLARLGESNRDSGRGNNNNDVISFTFNSPMKHKSGIPTEMEKRDSCDSTPLQNSIFDEHDGNTSLQKPFPLSRDTLGVILEQKLKELTCQEEEELAMEGTPQKRTTAMILQELISALTAERPFPQDDVAVRSSRKNVSCYHGHMSNSNITFQAKPKTAGASVGYSHDIDHLSPGSVLEACFSNDSCFSSSQDDKSGKELEFHITMESDLNSQVPCNQPRSTPLSGHKLRANSVDCSYDEPQQLEPDADLLDSATSLSKGRTGRELVIDLLNHISEVLHNFNLADAGLKGSKLTHTKEVILNAELLFESALLHNSDGTNVFSIRRFLLEKLETLASVIWMNFSCFLGFEDNKEGNQLKGFLIDCVMEYLDSRFGPYSKSGFKAWTRLPLCMNAEMLICEVVEEVRRWTDLVGLIPDELIEKEMSHSLGKWTDFEIEAFEMGVEIDNDILQSLVDEIVIDLRPCRLGSSGIAYGPF